MWDLAEISLHPRIRPPGLLQGPDLRENRAFLRLSFGNIFNLHPDPGSRVTLVDESEAGWESLHKSPKG